MDSADKMSRSGRQVKIPSKFMDMEVEDPTGRRSISINSPVISRPKQDPVNYTGKKRGRPPRLRSSLSVSDSQHSHDEFGNTENWEDSSPQESVEGLEPPNLQQTLTDDTLTTQSNSSPSPGVIGHGVDVSFGTHQASSAAVSNPVVPISKLARINLPSIVNEERPKRIRKKPASPDDNLPTPKRKRLPPVKGSLSDVELPPGLVEDMRSKRQVTAYSVYCREMRPVVAQEIPGGNFSDYSKALGNRWTALTDGERNRWKRVAHKVSTILAAERGTNDAPEVGRRPRDKLIREIEVHLKDPPTSAPFDLVSQIKLTSTKMHGVADALNSWSINKSDNPEPAGCSDALMDCAFVVISSTFSIMAQMPIFQEVVDKELLDELADTSSKIIPLL